MNEFHSIGFYMSDHPLKIYKDYFNKSKVVSFKDFVNGLENTALVAGTIMAIQEKKSAKGTPFAIVKFSDLESEFELFLFSDLLITNRDKLKMANSFMLTLQKDNSSNSAVTRRINIRNINSLSNFTDKAFERVTIEINGKSDLNELRNILKENGITKIQIKVCKKSKIYIFSLKNTRKFSLSIFNHIKNKEYVKKISF
jgi:DNA polymerase-3 subunit alpha